MPLVGTPKVAWSHPQCALRLLGYAHTWCARVDGVMFSLTLAKMSRLDAIIDFCSSLVGKH